MKLVADEHVSFPAYFVCAKTKTEQRRFAALHAIQWLRWLHRQGVRGAIYADIDDTLVDGNEQVAHGFDYMLEMYRQLSPLFVFHLCTARPDDDHAHCMKLLHRKKFFIDPDRLHMLPAHHYDGPTDHVRDFKEKIYQSLVKTHGRVVARFGDKKWDVFPRHAPHVAHVDEQDCYTAWDPSQPGTLSVKMPGEGPARTPRATLTSRV